MRKLVPLLLLTACAFDDAGVSSDLGPRSTACSTLGIACPPPITFDLGGREDAALPEDAFVPAPDALLAPDMPEPVDSYVSPCDGDGRFDSPSGLCVYRIMWDRTGPVCPSGMTPLEWRSLAEQHRLQDLLAGTGGGGTGLRLGPSGWEFMTSGTQPAEIDWAPDSPSSGEPYSAFGAAGLRSIPVAGIYQFCTQEP